MPSNKLRPCLWVALCWPNSLLPFLRSWQLLTLLVRILLKQHPSTTISCFNNSSPCFSLSLFCCLSFSVSALLYLLSNSGSPEGVHRCPTEPVQSQSFSLSAHHGKASDDRRRASGRPVVSEPGETEEPQCHMICVCGSSCVLFVCHVGDW